MKENTLKTKRKILYSISVIIFIIIFGVSLIFYSFINSGIKSDQFSKFEMIVNSFTTGEKTLEDLKNFKLNKTQDNTHFGELNFIVLDKNNKILSSYLPSNIREFTKKEIYDFSGNNYDKIDNFFVKNIYTTNSRIIFFYELYYSDLDMNINILNFFIIGCISTIILFFVLKKYLDKIFVPVEQNFKSMNEFVNNAGHELKTPLSVIVSNIDYYKKSKIKDENILQEIKDEAIKMGELINSLLALSKQNMVLNKENINIYDLFENIFKHFEREISSKNIKIINNLDKNLLLNLNHKHFEICTKNIISNAIRYNKQNGTINITFENSKFIIEDSGIGIDSKNLDKVFDRFFKEDSSRSSVGFGIGLSLVKKLCDINSWKIFIKSEKGKGSKVFLEI